jgi:dolichol-phosphate mannosyltransferase
MAGNSTIKRATKMTPESKTSVDIIIPVYNEESIIESTHARIRTVIDELPYAFTVYYVDDGSSDRTAEIIKEINDPRINLIELSRNFGHQAALVAGIDASTAEIAISMDGDGQHPPEMLPQMIDLVLQGYDIVQTQRIDKHQPNTFKKNTSGLFYKLINMMSGTEVTPGAADFRAMSRQAVLALRSMPEYHRFLRGMVSWIGYKSIILPYEPEDRSGGVSKYSLRKMVSLAMDAVFSFSLVPLYIGLSFGGLLLLLAIAELTYVLSFWVTGQTSNLAPGWSSLMFIILLVSGMLMIMMGFVGIYVGYIFQEVKRRPIYLIKTDRETSSPEEEK